MRNDPLYQETGVIKILDLAFDKNGSIEVEFTIDGEPGLYILDASYKEFEKLIPDVEGTCMDDNGVYNAVLEDSGHWRLHWLIVTKYGVSHQKVFLDPILEELITEKIRNAE